MATGKERSRWWLPIVVLAVVVAVGILVIDQDATFLEYRVRDADTIVVTAVGGNNWFWTRLDEVTESDTAVTVRVRSLEWPVPTGDIGIPYEFVIDLAGPLGDRIVLNGMDGSEVPLLHP